MLLIAGGTGIAPILSILRHVIEKGIERDMRLFWGVRAEADLYAHATLEALSRRAPSLKYAPVLLASASRVARAHRLGCTKLRSKASRIWSPTKSTPRVRRR